MRERGADAFEVEAEVVGDHVELVRGRELDVAPGVREELGELGLFDVEVDDRVGEAAEERSARATARSVRPETICGQLAQLDERLALGDALRAERHVDRLARLRQAAARPSR